MLTTIEHQHEAQINKLASTASGSSGKKQSGLPIQHVRWLSTANLLNKPNGEGSIVIGGIKGSSSSLGGSSGLNPSSSGSNGGSSNHSSTIPVSLVADPLFLYSHTEKPNKNGKSSQQKNESLLEQLYLQQPLSPSSSNNEKSEKTFSKQFSFDLHINESSGKTSANSSVNSQQVKNILVDTQLDELLHRYRSQITCINTSDNGKFVVFAIKSNENNASTNTLSRPNISIIIYSRSQQIHQLASTMQKSQSSSQSSVSQKIKTYFHGSSSSFDGLDNKKNKKTIGSMLGHIRTVQPPRGMQEMDGLSWRKKLKRVEIMNSHPKSSATTSAFTSNDIMSNSNELARDSSSNRLKPTNTTSSNLPPVSLKQIFISNDGYNVVCVTENNDVWLYDCFPSNRSNIANLFKYENSMFRINTYSEIGTSNSQGGNHRGRSASASPVYNINNSSTFSSESGRRFSEALNKGNNAMPLPSSNIDSMLEEETYHRYLMRTNHQGLFAIDDFGIHYNRNSIVGSGQMLPSPRDSALLSVSGMNLHFSAAGSSFAASTLGNYLQYSIEEWTILPSHIDGIEGVNHRPYEYGDNGKQVLLPNEDLFFDIKFCHSPIHGRFCQISSTLVGKMYVKQDTYKKMQELFMTNGNSSNSKKDHLKQKNSLGLINSNNASVMKHASDTAQDLSSTALVSGRDSDEESSGRSLQKSRRKLSVFQHMNGMNTSPSGEDNIDSDDEFAASLSVSQTLSRQGSHILANNNIKIPKLKLGSNDSEKKPEREMAFETIRNEKSMQKKNSAKNIGRMSMILSRSGVAAALDASNSAIATPRLTSRVGSFFGASADQAIPTHFDEFCNLPSTPLDNATELPNILSRCLVVTNCTVYLSKRKFSKSANSFNTNPIPTPRFPIIDHCPFQLNIDRTYTVLEKVLEQEDASMSKAFHASAQQKSIPECIVKWDNETSMLCIVVNSFDHSTLYESKVFFYSPLRRKSVCIVYGTKSLECLPMSRTSRNPTELVSFSVQDMCWSNNSLFVLLVDARGNTSMISRLNEFMLMKDKQLLQQSGITNFVPFYKNSSESRDLESTRFSITSHPYQGQFIVSDGYKIKLFNFVSERDEIDLTTILSSYHGSCFGIEQYIFHATYDKKSRIDTALDIWRLCVSHPQLSRFQKQNHVYLEFVIKKMCEYIMNHGETFSQRISKFFEILQDSLDWSINGVQNPNFLLPYLIKLTELVFKKLLKKEKKSQFERLADFLEKTERMCNELVQYCQSCFVWDSNTLGDAEADTIRRSPIVLFDCWVELGQTVQSILNRIKNKSTSEKKSTILKIISAEKKKKAESISNTFASDNSSDSDNEDKKKVKASSDSSDSEEESNTSTEYLGEDYEETQGVKQVISDDEGEEVEEMLRILLGKVIQKLKNRSVYLTNQKSTGTTNESFQERYATTLNPRSKSIYKYTSQDVKFLLTGNNQYMLGNYEKAVKYYSKIHESTEDSPTTIPSAFISYYTKSTVLFLTYLFMNDINEMFRVLNEQMHTGIVDLVRSSGILLEHHKTNISKGLGSGVLKSNANMNIINAVITLLTALYEKKDVFVLSPVFYQMLVDKIVCNDNKFTNLDLVVLNNNGSTLNANMAYYYVPLNMTKFRTNFESEMKRRTVNGKAIVNQLLLETGRIHEAIRFCLRFDYKKAYTIFLVTNGMLGSKETTTATTTIDNSSTSTNSLKTVPSKKVIGTPQKKLTVQYDTQQIVQIYKELLYEYLDKEDSKEVNTILGTTDFFISKQSDELRVGAVETYLRKLQFMLKETCSLLFLPKEDETLTATEGDMDNRRKRRNPIVATKKNRKLADLLDKEFLKTESHFLSNICKFIASQKPNKPTRKQREYYLSLLDAVRSGNLMPHISFRDYRLKYIRNKVNEESITLDDDSIPFATPVTTSRGDNSNNQPLIVVIEKECEKSVRYLIMDELIIFSNIPNLSFSDLLKYYKNEYCTLSPATPLNFREDKLNQLCLYIKPFRFLCRFLWYCHITEEITAITSNHQTNPFKLLYNHTQGNVQGFNLADTLVYTCELFAFLLDYREFFTRTFLESTLLTILTVAINISHSSKDTDAETEEIRTPQDVGQDLTPIDESRRTDSSMIAETICRILGKHMHDSQQVVPHLGKRYMQLYKVLDPSMIETNIKTIESMLLIPCK